MNKRRFFFKLENFLILFPNNFIISSCFPQVSCIRHKVLPNEKEMKNDFQPNLNWMNYILLNFALSSLSIFSVFKYWSSFSLFFLSEFVLSHFNALISKLRLSFLTVWIKTKLLTNTIWAESNSQISCLFFPSSSQRANRPNWAILRSD